MNFGPSTEYEKFGSGDPKTMVIGGLSFCPDDMEELAKFNQGTLEVQYQPQLDQIVEVADDVDQIDRDATGYYLGYLDENSVDRIIGISLGCRHALMAASDKNINIPELVLVAPPLRCPNTKELRRSTDLTIDLKGDGKLGTLHGMLYGITQPMRDEVYRTMLDRHANQGYGYDPKTSRRLMMMNAATLNQEMVVKRTREYLEAFNGKLTLIYGDQDPFFDQATLDQLLKFKPDAQVVPALKGVGHFPHVERPEQLAEIVNQMNVSA